MGVGKTTIGKMLANTLGLKFIDCDEEIERRSGADITWIFDIEGESGFRERESAVLDELTSRDGVLLATGGGAVLRKENRERLKGRGMVVHLDADLELLVERTARGGKRPLLEEGDPGQVLQKLKTERDPLYKEVRHLRVFVGCWSSAATVKHILSALASDEAIDD